jgi:hypothetical protein
VVGRLAGHRVPLGRIADNAQGWFIGGDADALDIVWGVSICKDCLMVLLN